MFKNSLVKKYSVPIALGLVFLIAFILRIFHLGSLPFNLMEDEVLSGYVGRFILENGVDLYGNPWPLFYFDKFGDYYIIGPMYLTGLSTFLFGVNAFAVRFPAAFFGSLIVFPVYVFTHFIFKNKKISLMSSLLIAITPWHLILSRSMVEGVIGSTIFLTGIVCFLMFVEKKKIIWIISGIALVVVSYFIYHPFRLYAPVAFLPLVLIFPTVRKNSFSQLIPLVFVIISFITLTLYISSTPWGKGRFVQTSIFSPLARVEGRLQEQIFNMEGNRILEARIFHNKAVGYGREFITQYLSYFSPLFLFVQGGAESRYDVPEQGLVYFTYLLLIIASLLPIKTKVKVQDKYLLYYLYLLLLAPVPAAFTYFGAPNIHRSVFFVVLLVIPAAYGLYKLTSIKKYNVVIVPAVAVLLLGEFLYFWHQYSVQSDIYTAIRRNDAQRQVVEYIEANKSKYDKVYLPSEGTMSLYVLFYSQNFDPELAGKFKHDVKLDSVGKYQFVESSCPAQDLEIENSGVLVVNRYDCGEPESFTKLETIKGKNKLLGFDLYTR